MNNSFLSLVVALFFSATISAQIFSDDFGNDGGGLPSTSVVLTDQCFDGTLGDYFGVVLESEISEIFLNADGAFLAAQDMDGGPCTTGIGTANWPNINIAGQTGLVLCLDIAEGDDDTNQDWDEDSQVVIAVTIGGNTETLGTITSQGAVNTFPGFDCNSDGVGDGIEITNSFTTFCFSINATDSSMDVNISISGLDAGDEDIAFDNMAVYSDSNPTSTVLNAACGGVAGCTDAAACNYNASATVNNGTCYNIGDACDDGDITTNTDVWISCTTCQGMSSGLDNCDAPVWEVISPTLNVNAFNNFGEWESITNGFSANGFCGSGCAEPVSTWLVYGPLNLSNTSALNLVFDASEAFGVTDLNIVYTTDYSSACPTTTTWTTVGTVTDNGLVNVDFSEASGSQVYIGIDYTDDGTDGFSAWNLTNFQFLANVCPSVGTPIVSNCGNNLGCTTASACNYDPDAEIDDGSCINIGDACDDDNNMTVNDVLVDCNTCQGQTVNPELCPIDAKINEFHYDNVGTDANEFIEVALPANSDPTQIQITLYNGGTGESYSSIVLSAANAVNSDGTFDYYVWYPESIQNGNDGIAISCIGGILFDFITYEGAFMATDGPFAGVTGVDIGVDESSDMTENQSIMNDGAGNYANYCIADAGSANDINSCVCDPLINNNCFSTCTQTINLNPGWNLVSLDVSPAENAISIVFGGLQADNLEFITGFDNGAKVFNPSGPSFLNTLTQASAGFGYWVKVTNADVLNVEGDCLDDNFRKPFDAGWNLVAYPPDAPQSPATYFADLINTEDLEFITGFDNGATTFNPFGPIFLNSLTEMKNGFGYWVKVTNPSNQ